MFRLTMQYIQGNKIKDKDVREESFRIFYRSHPVVLHY